VNLITGNVVQPHRRGGAADARPTLAQQRRGGKEIKKTRITAAEVLSRLNSRLRPYI
jgi:hypothetical protein